MPLDQNKSFVSSLSESTATSMSSSSGLTINNQIIGGLHVYPLLSNIINTDVNNKIPLIFQPAGSSTTTFMQAGCDDDNTDTSSVCYLTAAGVAQVNKDPANSYQVGDAYANVCGKFGDTTLNTFCAYEKTVIITTPASLGLNPDLHSSGRLQLGMIVYIQEKKQAYQFMIDNYKALYDAAEADIITSQFNSTVPDSSPASQSLIEAWTVHKVEGELKDPDNPDQGVWSRDEANWKKYPNVPEYFTINAVPGSEEVDGFNFEDAYIVVPQEWDGKKVVSVEASFFSAPASPNSLSGSCQISLTQTNLDPNGSTITSNISFDHNKGEKASTSAFSSPLQLIGNSTLHLSVDSSFGSDHKGYTATFKVIS